MGNICTHCLLELKVSIQLKAQQPLQLVAVGPQKLNRLAGLQLQALPLSWRGNASCEPHSYLRHQMSDPAVASVLALQAPVAGPRKS